MKKFFRIVIKGPHPQVFYDYEVPETAQLPQFWANVVGAGYVLTDKFMVSAAEIAHVSVVTEAQAVVYQGPKVVN